MIASQKGLSPLQPVATTIIGNGYENSTNTNTPIMRRIVLFTTMIALGLNAHSQMDSLSTVNQMERLERNKEIARNFYQDLWFTDNTDKYIDYVAEEYVVHDIGDRKGVTEPAMEQKIIADRFWDNGTWDSKINYQIAEGNLVATRWEATYRPSTFLGKVVFGSGTIPIINVFRINEEGKIVEIWNHRHDIDTPQTMKFTSKGLFDWLVDCTDSDNYCLSAKTKAQSGAKIIKLLPTREIRSEQGLLLKIQVINYL